jgi:lipopolysaccharide export system permease protein
VKLFPGKTYSLLLLREFVKVFLVCVLFIMGLSFIVRTLQKLDREATFGQTVVMRVLEAPEIISRECLLASCMFASVYLMSQLTGNRELLALRSCGVSAYRILSPLVMLGVVISGGSLLFEDLVVVPSFTLRDRYAAGIRGEEERGVLADRYNLIVFGEGNVVYKIDRYLSARREMRGVMVMKKDEEGNVVFRIDAERAGWEAGAWLFQNGTMRRFAPDGSLTGELRFERMPTDISDAPRHFARDVRQVENMSLAEAAEYVATRRKMGFGYRRELTKLHRKIASSVTLLLVMVTGLSLGTVAFRNALVMSFSLTLLTVLVLYFLMEIGYTFGSSGQIPPLLGGWLGNIVFAPGAGYLMIRIR